MCLAGTVAEGGAPLPGAYQGRLFTPDHRCAAGLVSVDLNPHLLVLRKIRAFADRVNRAGRNAGRTINACDGIDIHTLIVPVEARYRADQNAIREPTVAAVPSNHMGHGRSSFERRFRGASAARRGHDS